MKTYAIPSKLLAVKITLTNELLGTKSADPEIYRSFIASKAPDAPTREQEVEELGVEEVFENAITVFPKLDDGTPFIYDYQIKGFMKEACGALRRVTGTQSSKVRAYKKIIDGLVFIEPRKISIEVCGDIGKCERPLRAQTAQGERIAISASETIPSGSTLSFSVRLLDAGQEPLVLELLEYGQYLGIGQWRSGGKGTFAFEVSA